MNGPDLSQAWIHGGHTLVDDGLLPIGGVMADQIRAYPWHTTSLGPIETWPASLLTTLRIVLASKQTMCFWWGRELISFHNDTYIPILGQRADRALGRPFTEVWADVWDGVLPFVQEALAGRSTWMEDLPLVMTRNGYEEETWWTFSYSPLYDDHGAVAGLLNIVTETTKSVKDRMALSASYIRASEHLKERERYEDELRLLNGELAHRMKNTLAMTTSIVSQTLKDVPFADDVRRGILGRITALSKAQDLLTATSWAAADLRTVIDLALAPHVDHPERFRLTGENLELTTQRALSLALSVHELATNAIKYGALREPAGRVGISWTVVGDTFSFEWKEEFGPDISVPAKTGFGSRILRYATPAAFSGQADLHFETDGLRYALNGRLSDRG